MLDDLIAGLTILRPHCSSRTGFSCERDIFRVGATDSPLCDAEIRDLRNLGWFQEYSPGDKRYSPGDGWSLFC